MDKSDLISKKELLQKYGISYGALYRWKRMGLIPEDWFLRRSTPTGQETFFYRGQICPRVELIQSHRDLSLEDLAEELHGPVVSKPLRRLIITDSFNEKGFVLDDLRGVQVTEGEKTLDLLDYLKGVSL